MSKCIACEKNEGGFDLLCDECRSKIDEEEEKFLREAQQKGGDNNEKIRQETKENTKN